MQDTHQTFRTIIYAPFIPFIVIFCHVIETSDPEDLRRLELFVQSFKGSCDVSPAVDKLYHLSRVLYNVALLYVEAKAQQIVDQNMVTIGNEFDMYLNQLGFMSNDISMAAGPANNDGDDTTKPMLQTTQLGDWFSGNNHVMGMLEEDLSTFQSPSW